MQGASEPSAFLQWQKEMKKKDLQEELAQLERRRLEGKISHEEALLARQRVLELNQNKVLLKKEEVNCYVFTILKNHLLKVGKYIANEAFHDLCGLIDVIVPDCPPNAQVCREASARGERNEGASAAGR